MWPAWVSWFGFGCLWILAVIGTYAILVSWKES